MITTLYFLLISGFSFETQLFISKYKSKDILINIKNNAYVKTHRLSMCMSQCGG